MLKARIIPCLDVNAGRVVKGIKFQNLRDAGDPVELSFHYQEQGADEIVILDVSATREDRLAMLETIESVRRKLCIPLTVGGGVSVVEDAGRLLGAGADKVSVNSAAVRNPELIAELSTRFGAQCTVVAIDARQLKTNELGASEQSQSEQSQSEQSQSEQSQSEQNEPEKVWEVVTRSGTQAEPLDAVSWSVRAQQLGAGEILLTSFDRDGTRSGYDLDLMDAVTSACTLPVIASGGANSVDHMVDAFQHGAHAVLAASIFHEGNFTVAEVKKQLSAQGIQVRQ